jgi:hypothetical protein
LTTVLLFLLFSTLCMTRDYTSTSTLSSTSSFNCLSIMRLFLLSFYSSSSYKTKLRKSRLFNYTDNKTSRHAQDSQDFAECRSPPISFSPLFFCFLVFTHRGASFFCFSLRGVL